MARPGRLAPDRLSSLRRVATIESVGSFTHIEGAKLSDREVEQLLSNLEVKVIGSRDGPEVAGYADPTPRRPMPTGSEDSTIARAVSNIEDAMLTRSSAVIWR